MIYFTADTHFGHKNVIRYDETSFSTIGEYDEYLIKQWNSVVTDEDTVYHLGDFAFGSQEALRGYAERLKGRKRLILGNHDTRKLEFYQSIGFNRVYDHPIVLRNFFILSHNPLYMTPSMPYFNIFGHVHIHPAFQTKTEKGMCVCGVRHDWKPVLVPEWEAYTSELDNEIKDL